MQLKEDRMAAKNTEMVKRIAERQRWREEDARVMVEAWLSSGESVSDFARGHGLRGERISRWASRFPKGEKESLSFHQVRLVESQDRFHPDVKIEVMLSDGRSVRVPHGFAPEELQKVLRVLEEGVWCWRFLRRYAFI
jgi:transposase-like protein